MLNGVGVVVKIDSLLGATLQFSGYDSTKRKVVETPGPGVKHISGYNCLDNHMVKFTSCIRFGSVALPRGYSVGNACVRLVGHCDR